MADYTNNYFVQNHKFEDPTTKLVYEIINFIKIEHDYTKAINTLIENNLTFHDVISRTIRLSTNDLIIFANELIKVKTS